MASQSHSTTPSPRIPTANDWPQLLLLIRKEKPLLAAKLEYASLQSVNESKLVIGFKKEQEFFYTQVNSPENLKLISDLLVRGGYKKLQVETLVTHQSQSTASPKEIEKKASFEKEEAIRSQVEAHPLIQETANVFNTKIKNIKEIT